MTKLILNSGRFMFGILFCFLAATHVLAEEKHIAAGINHSLYVDVKGNVWTWGNTNLSSNPDERVPYLSMQKGRAVFASPEEHISYVIKQDGSLWGWGGNRVWSTGHYP